MTLLKREIKEIYLGTSRLPSTYQEVEYIQSSGTQYIDTGWYPTGTSEIDIDFQWNSDKGIFGVDSNWTNKAFSLFQDRIISYGTQAQNQQSYFTSGSRYHIIFNSSRQCYVNDVLKYTYSSETFTSTISAYIFGKRRNNYVESYSAMKLYYLKLWNNGTLERDFVPCYRKSDNVIGLYDLVNNTFYTNAGTGTFTKGNNKNTPTQIKEVYVGTTKVRPGWTPGANTLAYWKLNGNLNDSSGNNRNLTNAGGLTFATVDGVECAYYNGVGTGNCYAYCQTLPTPSVITINIWAKANSSWTGSYARGLFHTNCNAAGTNDGIRWEFYSGSGVPTVPIGSGINYNEIRYNGVNYNSIKDKWCMWTVVYDNTTYKVDIYLNGQSNNSSTFSSNHPSRNWCGFFTLGTGFNATDSRITRKRYGWISESIVENKARTAQEISDYYNQTKGNYGL